MLSEESYKKKIVYYFLVISFLLWVILFEFILPVNTILPKPSIVILSLSDLWHIYKIAFNYLSTFSIIIFSLVSAYFLVWMFRIPLTKGNNLIFSFITSIEWFSNYIPGVILALLLVFWFPGFEFTDLIFALTAALLSMILKFRKETRLVKKEYADSVRSLGASEKFIAGKVIWKAVEPSLFDHLIKLNFYLWSALIFFEYVKGTHGLGYVIKLTIQFGDLSAFFTLLIIIGLTLFLLKTAGKLIKLKYFFWETERD